MIFRVLDRMSGDAELSADLAQEAFIRLHGRGSLPDRPDAWLVTVALNLLRNAQVKRTRRLRLLTGERALGAHADPTPPPPSGVESSETASAVRVALDALPARERAMLLLQAEGYAHREIASLLDLNEASVGKLLSRARDAFRTAFEGAGS